MAAHYLKNKQKNIYTMVCIFNYRINLLPHYQNKVSNWIPNYPLTRPPQIIWAKTSIKTPAWRFAVEVYSAGRREKNQRIQNILLVISSIPNKRTFNLQLIPCLSQQILTSTVKLHKDYAFQQNWLSLSPKKSHQHSKISKSK